MSQPAGEHLDPAAAPSPARVTVRALVLGLVTSLLACAIVAWAEWVRGTIMIGFLQIPPVAIALLFLVVVGNRLLGRLWPRTRLQPAELVVVYVMTMFSAMIASRGLTEDLYPTQAGLNYFATPANHWQSLYFGHLRPALVPWDPRGEPGQAAMRSYFESLPEGEALPWGRWLHSSAAWLVLVGLVYTAFLGMAAIVYRRWADEEHLSFPLTVLPLDLVLVRSGAADFLRNRLMWLGFAVALVYFGLNGLHEIWPQVPQIPTSYSLQFTSMPWRNIGYTVMWFSLAGVGLFYLLPSEMVLSLWFFFGFARLQEVVAAALVGPSVPAAHAGSALFVADQTTGVCVALVALMTYTSWAYVRQAHREGSTGATGGAALLPFRSAAALVVAALVGILVWWQWAGGHWLVALLEFGGYLFVQAIIMARATSEAGTPMTEGSFTPLDLIGLVMPRSRVGGANLTLLAFSNALFTRDLRGIPLTGMLDAQRLGDGVGLARRKLVPLVVLALIVAVVASGYLHLRVTYEQGGVSMYSYVYQGNDLQFWREFAPLVEGPEAYRSGRPVWFGVGVLTCVALGLLRRLFVWWPLHPLGAALSVTWIMCVFWFPALVAWVLKTAITRYGGLKAYVALRPLFLGMIFGEFMMAVLWTVVSFCCGTRTPVFPWP